MKYVKVIDIKAVIVSIIIPLAVGGLSSALASSSSDVYSRLEKPPLSPPGAVFPVVWTILYILMGISAYLIWERYRCEGKGRAAIIIYAVQLFLNFCWSIIFFTLGLPLAAFVVLCLLIVEVVAMIIAFGRISPCAAALQIPYLLWCIFAAYLNLAIWIINK